jgi:two-component system, OmpR family, sensor histidine kinase CiaH
VFHSARLKLTAWYLLIIMVISLSFSGVIYQGWRNEVDRFEQAQRMRLQRRLEGLIMPDGRIIQPLPMTDPELLDETKWRLLYFLGFINGSILLLAGGLSYFLAGRTLQPIKKMVDDQNRFIGDASHELRTPLASLKSAFEVYLRDKNKTLKDSTNIISESIVEVDRLSTLSESLLSSIRNHQSPASLKIEKVVIKKIINKAVKRISSIAKRKGIKIENKEGNWTVNGDQQKLTELFVTLLDNAIKDGKKDGWIKIVSIKTDHEVQISVEDNGQGISKNDLPHVFDRFYRADVSRTKQTNDGFGLGLSIAKQIAEIHHGSIEVESQLGHGSTFIVKLPVT